MGGRGGGQEGEKGSKSEGIRGGDGGRAGEGGGRGDGGTSLQGTPEIRYVMITQQNTNEEFVAFLLFERGLAGLSSVIDCWMRWCSQSCAC